MKFWKFALYTSIGAGIWNCVLATLGWYLHSFVPLDQLNSKIEEYNSHIQIIVVAVLVLIALIAGLMWYFKRKKKQASISK